jgi:hypothetical protein
MAADMRVVNRWTRRQRGLITRLQALGAGLTDGEITGLLRRMIWIEIRPGVYAVAGAPPSWEQAVQAVLLSAGVGAYGSHGTAGYLWAIRKVVRSEHIEVVTELDRRVTLEGVLGHRSRELFDADLTTRLGIPSVTAARALVDLSGSMRYEVLGKALDDLLRRKVCTLDEVRRCVGRLHPGPGRPLRGMHRVLAERWEGYDPGESDLETRAIRSIARAGLPLPRQQYRMRLAGKPVRIDLAYPAERIAIEVDSWEYHGKVRSAFDVDHIRRDELILLQWVPFTFTAAMSDDYIVSSTRTLLAHAEARARGEIGESGAA